MLPIFSSWPASKNMHFSIKVRSLSRLDVLKGHTMTVRSPWMWLLIAIVVLPISSYLVFWTSLYAIAELVEDWRPAWIGDSSYAEIIVLVPDRSLDGFSAELIPVSSAGSYAAAHPGSTFLIPIDRQNEIQERLKTNLKVSWMTFEIKRLSESQEEITIYFMDPADDSHGSRYRASNDKVQLESYRYAADRGGIGIVLLAMFVTLGVNALLLGYFVVRAIYLWRKNVRSRNTAT
jgi:hypothetical protein